MRILWFTNTPSLYEQSKHLYHGGGWIESLERLLRQESSITLAISFFHTQDARKKTLDNVIYYPIKRKRKRNNPLKAVVRTWLGKIEEEDYEQHFSKIIEDFKPDVIQVFGTEGPFGLIQKATATPVLVHLQGLVNPIQNAYYPANTSGLDFLFDTHYFKNSLIGSSPFFNYKRLAFQAEREVQIFKTLKYVCGRTEWDRRITYLFNNQITYFHVEEVLRPIFYKNHVSLIDRNAKKKFIIFSTLSPSTYKGIEVILRTAKQLSQLVEIEFEWRIAGLDTTTNLLQFFEKKEEINHFTVYVKPLGIVNPEQLVEEMLNADVFVHPSYIDNSPNSVCEAQMMGLPVIASDVGGVNSLITHNENGFLVPSNGVYEFVYYLQYLHKEVEIKKRMGKKAKEVAERRHDKNRIVKELLAIYSKIQIT